MALGTDRLDFRRLAVAKEELQQTKTRSPKAMKLGTEEFLLASHCTGSGYPFLLGNDALSVQCGEYNKPSFYVVFRSFAL